MKTIAIILAAVWSSINYILGYLINLIDLEIMIIAVIFLLISGTVLFLMNVIENK
jgi:hypothetical protein